MYDDKIQSPESPATTPQLGARSFSQLQLDEDSKSPIEVSPLSPTQYHELHKQQAPSIPTEPQPPPFPTWKPFSLPTDNDSLSSGFPYHSRLRELRITPDQWLQFTTEVITAAKLSFAENAAAWTTGVTTGTLSSAFLLIFGPVVGFYAGKAIHRKTVAKKTKEKLAMEGPLRTTMRQWNEGVFMERGVQLWLEVPTENGEVIVDIHEGATEKAIKKRKNVLRKRFRFICMPYDPRDLPMGTDHSPASPAMMRNKENWSSVVSLGVVGGGDGKMEELMDERAEPKEMSSVRPAGELAAIPRKALKTTALNHGAAYELDGSSAPVKA